MVTIKDIANRLGVSVSTVSKGLNGANDISAELRSQVLDAAVEMGYSTKRSRKVENRKLVIFIENMQYKSSDEFGYDIVLGFKQNAFRNNWDVSIVTATKELQLSEKYDNYLLKHGFCGAFLMGFALQDEWMTQLPGTTMPTVLFDNYIPHNPNVCYIGTDSYEGIEMAVRHLYGLGHRKIAFLDGSRFSMVSEERMDAFLSAMAALELPVDERMAVYGHFVSSTASYHVPSFLNAGTTAIMCGNDLIASGVIEECRARGLRVPEDISVVGFDDTPIASKMNLTTIRQNRNYLGRAAYAILNDLIHHIQFSKTLMRPSLIERGSTGKPC